MSLKPVTKLAAAMLLIGALPAVAGDDGRRDRAERDCTPINGRNGYYGNPWCDGWDSDSTGHTITFDIGPDGRVRTERSYKRNPRIDNRR